MTKEEYANCEKVMNEAIRTASEANKEFIKAGNCHDTTERHILEAKAWKHRGYANGICQALAFVGFKHKDIEKLNNLIN